LGGVLTPHTFPGSSRAIPRSQNFSCSPNGIQFTTRAVMLQFGRPSNRTAVPTSTGRAKTHTAALRIYEDHRTRFGKRTSRIETREGDKKPARDSGAPPWRYHLCGPEKEFHFVRNNNASKSFAPWSPGAACSCRNSLASSGLNFFNFGTTYF
jgi:hypothetical protein